MDTKMSGHREKSKPRARNHVVTGAFLLLLTLTLLNNCNGLLQFLKGFRVEHHQLRDGWERNRSSSPHGVMGFDQKYA